MTVPSRLHAGLRKGDIRKSLTFFNWNLSFRSIYESVNAVTGFVFTDFVLSLGVAKEKMGVFAALAYLACFFQLLGLVVSNAVRNRKGFVLLLGLFEPLLYIAAIIAALFVPAGWRFSMLAGFIFLSAGMLHLTRPTTEEWLASSIPEPVRGRYLGWRLMLSSIVLVAITYGVGFLVQHIGRGNSLGFALVLVAGAVPGMLAVAALRRVPMPGISATARFRWADLLGILRQRIFFVFLLGIIGYNLPFYFGVPYYQVFNLQVLHMSESLIALMMIGYYVTKVVVSPLFGRLADRLGPRRTVYLVAPLYLVFFLLYAICTPERYWLIFIGWILAGVGDAGFAVASMTALYSVIPVDATRKVYFAFYNLASLLLISVGAAAGVVIVEALKTSHVTLGPFSLGQFQLFYAGCALLFIPCIFSSQLFPGRRRAR